ncbi:PilZ domain-containing protein [Pseudothauera nasutitermitis]|uniref:PilZ domain-containing protein n=1 Tax=Pseudothauera nasutitermitis TaxID=2565930 RepID=A0A4S4AVK1_9RHOO|nr:PilZ domain-containing protein [Pseudothauera nasutitermitis]THF64041.1 PilZ domain-containing protein [Pseudothauera nasutitermitis]
MAANDEAPAGEEQDSVERRSRQRFLATRWGQACFWVIVDDIKLALNDLSLEGFAYPASTAPASGRDFPFVLVRSGVPDEIRGIAQVVNYLQDAGGGQAGCAFVSFEGDGAERLNDWLVAHVIANATVRITEQDARNIVSGGSLI